MPTARRRRITTPTSEEHDRFVRLAESRVNRVLDGLELLGQLGNADRYEYTDREVDAIRTAIDEARDRAIGALEERRSIRTAGFTLGDDQEDDVLNE